MLRVCMRSRKPLRGGKLHLGARYAIEGFTPLLYSPMGLDLNGP